MILNLLLALFLASSIPLLFIGILLLAIAPEGSKLVEVFYALLDFAPLVYPLTFIFGVPLYLFFRDETRFHKLRYSALVGATIGFLSIMLNTTYLNVGISVIGIIFGTISGMIFWGLARPFKLQPVSVAHAKTH